VGWSIECKGLFVAVSSEAARQPEHESSSVSGMATSPAYAREVDAERGICPALLHQMMRDIVPAYAN